MDNVFCKGISSVSCLRCLPWPPTAWIGCSWSRSCFPAGDVVHLHCEYIANCFSFVILLFCTYLSWRLSSHLFFWLCMHMCTISHISYMHIANDEVMFLDVMRHHSCKFWFGPFFLPDHIFYHFFYKISCESNQTRSTHAHFPMYY